MKESIDKRLNGKGRSIVGRRTRAVGERMKENGGRAHSNSGCWRNHS